MCDSGPAPENESLLSRGIMYKLTGMCVVLCLGGGVLALSAEPQEPTVAGTIWFHRNDSSFDSILNPTIYSGTRKLAKLEKGQFFGVPASPGTHYFSCKDNPSKGEQAWVLIEVGQERFFQVKARSIGPVDAAKAKKDVPKSKPIEMGNVFDFAVTTAQRKSDLALVASTPPLQVAPRPGMIRWAYDVPGSDYNLRDGEFWEILESDGLTVSASIFKVKWDWLHKNYVVRLHVKNASERRVEIDSAMVTLIAKGKRVDAVTVGHLIKVHGRAAPTSWTTVLGKSATADALQAQSAALKANTVLPGEEVDGDVWFKQKGKALIVQVSMDGKVFEFPFRFR